MVTRLTPQKGIDLVLEAVPDLLADGAQLAILGSGQAPLEESLMEQARDRPGELAVRIGYDDDLARRIYAGSDAFVMPSRYEPCGLGQLIALRYGAAPIVRRTGGLADTVKEFDPARRTGTGFTFEGLAPAALVEAVRRAAGAHGRPAAWNALVRNAMAEDFSWGASAREYVTLYRKAARARAAR
jgi:starch synthase